MKKRFLFVVLVALTILGASNALVGAQGGAAIPRGGTFVVSEGQQAPFVRDFDPYAANPIRWTRGAVYESLMIFNAPKNELVPWLATGYKYSDDLKTLTFTLQQNVKWSDGEPFNADDLVFTLDMFKKFPAMDRNGLLPYYDSAEKIDDYTVAIHLTQVYTVAHFLFANTWPLPEHIWSKIADPTTYIDENPVGTGPLATVKTVNEQVLEICRNPNYWQMGEDGKPLPYVDCMRMPVYAGNDPANLAAVNGEVDWIANFMPDIENTFVKADPEHHHYYFWPGSNVVAMYYNITKAPFSDVKFRQALSQAINYDDVANIGEYGYAVVATPNGLSTAFQANWSQAAMDKANELGLGKFDPEKAKATLDAAGYKDVNNDGWRENPDGSALTFKIQVVNGWTDWVTSVQIMSQSFQDVGLNAVIDVLDFGPWLQNLQQGTYDSSIGWGSGGAPTAYTVFKNTMDSGLIGSDGTANAQLWSRWTSPETDAALKDYPSTLDAKQQQADLDTLQMAMVDVIPNIPLFPGPTWYEWNDARFTGFPTKDDYYVQGSSWTVAPDQYMIVLMKIHCVSEDICAKAQ